MIIGKKNDKKTLFGLVAESCRRVKQNKGVDQA